MSTENERKNHVFKAKLADQAERYEEMVESMKSVAILNVELTIEESNLLSVAYKNATSARRVSWNVLSSILQKEDALGNEIYVNLIKGYRKKIEEELSEFCSDILMILEKNLLTSTRSVEATIFYLKMRGDYFRYLAEFKSGLERKEVVDQSMKGYEEAFAAAETELPSTHPIRLGLALNFSIFYYEIMNNRERAYQMAKQSFDDAIVELETSYEESFKDITLIMQLLRDSLTLYSTNLLDDRGDENLKDAEAKPAEL